MPDNTLLGAHYDGGVQARPHDYDADIWAKQLYVSIKVTDDQARVFYAFLQSQLGAPYDMRIIAAFAEGVLMGSSTIERTPGAWICSGLMSAALITAGIRKDNEAPINAATPRDVLFGLGMLTMLGDVQSRQPPQSAMARRLAREGA